jgi:hypothetical protein
MGQSDNGEEGKELPMMLGRNEIEKGGLAAV